MAGLQVNEVDELIKEMKKVPGFLSYIILNNDGIVIRWDQQSTSSSSTTAAAKMTYQKAVQYSHLVLDLCGKCKSHVKDLFEAPENLMENIRLRTKEYEMIISQQGNYTLVVLQDDKDITITNKKGKSDSSKDGSGKGVSSSGEKGDGAE